MNRRRGAVAGGLFLALFSLPFAAVGVGMSVWLWRDVLFSREIRSTWIEAPAVIQVVNLKSQRGSKGGTTYKVEGTFEYIVDDVSRHSSWLGLTSGSDNIGDYHQKLYAELKAAQKSGRPLMCRVDPTNPERAILRPDWRPEMALFRAVFGTVFGGIGFSLFFGCFAGIASDLRTKRLKRRHPAEPWLWREEWAHPVLHAKLGGGLLVATGILLMTHAATLPLWSALEPAWATAGAFKWILSGALALVLVISAICARVILHALKYRGARLEFDLLPMRLGTPVEARLYLPKALPLGAVLEMSLFCSHRVTTGRGKQRKTTTTKGWAHSHSESGPIAPGQAVPFRCRLPADAPATTFDNPNDLHLWEFTAKADVPGVDLKITFEVPVFAGAPSK